MQSAEKPRYESSDKVLAVLVSSGFRVITSGDKGKLFVLFIPLFTLFIFSKSVCSLCDDLKHKSRMTVDCGVFKLLQRSVDGKHLMRLQSENSFIRQTDRQADRQTGGQADRQADRQTGGQADRQADRQTG